MPSTFSVKAGNLPPIQQFIADVCRRTGWELLICANLLDEDETVTATEWKKNTHYIFYLPFESTRGIELCLIGSKCHVKLMSISSHADFALARELIREILRYSGGGISCDDGLKAKSVDSLNDTFDQDWFAEFSIAAVENLFASVTAEADGYVGLVGPSRYFYFGQGLAKEMLEYSEDELDIIEKLWPLMQKVQYMQHYPEYEGYTECAQYELELPRLKGKTFAFLPPDEGALVPMTDFLGLEGRQTGEFALLPAKQFRTVLPKVFESDKLVWLDEFQFVLAPMKSRKYKMVVEELMPHCKRVLL